MRYAQKTIDELRQMIVDITSEIADRAGKGLVVEDRDGKREIPTFGYLLEVQWATDDYATVTWYPDLDSAQAALAIVAGDQKIHRFYTDLTVAGCQPSWASINVKTGRRI